jgi:threo-3-hydroxy-L-aspartate ammonia-lyase
MALSRQYSHVTLTETDAPLIAEITAAANRLAGVALRTPLLPFRDGSFIKAESLQPTGSFKIRGAYNALAKLSAEERARGVVVHSSGNHAQAIARAARLLGMRAVVVMPNNAPDVKVAGVRADGGEIVFVGPHNVERVAKAHEIAHQQGLIVVSSANHADVVAGQGTAGFEIADQLRDQGIEGEVVVLVPVGLGGLSAGISTALASVDSRFHVYGVEPELAADTRDSIAAGERTEWAPEDTGRTIADGLRAEAPAPIPFELLKRNLAGVITVAEGEIIDAMRVAAREARLVLEPSGATALAALLNHRGALPAGTVVAVATGGNVDPARYVEWLSGAETAS